MVVWLAFLAVVPTARSAEAPDNHAILRHELAGTLFVPKKLKEKYDSLLARARDLRSDILEARIEEPEARRRIAEVKREIEAALREIEEKKVLVPEAELRQASETFAFDLGPDACLFIDAAKVRIVGWDRPGVKCVLEKSFIGPIEEGEGDPFEAIRVEHRRVRASDVISSLRREEAGRGESAAGPRDETALLERLAFEGLRGREIDALRTAGLSHDEGNRQIILRSTSPGGAASTRSVWRRHADLTVYVPRCRIVAVRGGLRGLDVQSLKATLALSGQGDQDYDAAHRVENLDGSLIARGVPIDRLENIAGDVSIVLPAIRESTSNAYGQGTVTRLVPDPKEYIYAGIRGDFAGWFRRAKLRLEGVAGRVDVRNDFGDTTFFATGKLAVRAHRIVSEAGHIEVRLGEDVLGDLPVTALSECGRIEIPASFRALDPVQFSRCDAEGSPARTWGGFVTKKPGPFPFWYQNHVDLILKGRERDPGLDLVSRAGSVRILVTE